MSAVNCLWALFVVIFSGAPVTIRPVLTNDATELTPENLKKLDSIIFEHYSTDNPTEPKLLNVHDESSLQHVDVSLPLKVLIHGWLGNPVYMEPIRDKYVQTKKCNVVMVDWTKLSSNLNYKKCAGYTELAARSTARLLDKLAAMGQDMGQVHVAGHSLGGQTAGVVGAFTTAGRIGKITGLDPAGPGFSKRDLKFRLDPSDGELVEAIHTNEGTLGSTLLMGHMDFYPNGGKDQPGCIGDNSMMMNGGCSHMRAVDYFAESIVTEFVGTKCDSYKDWRSGNCKGNPTAVMGDRMVMSEPGKYYFATHSEPPYAIV